MRISLGSVTTFATVLLLVASERKEQIYSIGFPPNEGTFNVIDGKPYLLRKGERGSAGNAIDIKPDGKLIHVMSEKPLAYPLDGDSPVITLGKVESVSDKWDHSAVVERRGGPLKAAEGKFKGWYLDWSETEAEIVAGGITFHTRKPITFHTRQLILVKEPKSPRMFTKYPVSK